jgi:thioredoxin-related protein
MHVGRRTLILTIFTVFLALSVQAQNGIPADSNEKPEIHWLDYSQGIKKADSDSVRHVIIDFTASWCGWCKKMDATTFQDSAVIDYINTNFIPVRVWGDSRDTLNVDGYKITQAALAKEFGVNGYPAFWFVNPEGLRIGPLPGYHPPERFIKFLGMIVDREYEKQSKTEGDSKADPGK